MLTSSLAKDISSENESDDIIPEPIMDTDLNEEPEIESLSCDGKCLTVEYKA